MGCRERSQRLSTGVVLSSGMGMEVDKWLLLITGWEWLAPGELNLRSGLGVVKNPGGTWACVKQAGRLKPRALGSPLGICASIASSQALQYLY